MRPSVLFPLFAPVTALPGVGPRLGAAMARVAGEKVVDLLWHLPAGLIDRSYAPKVAEAQEGRIATLRLRVDAHLPPPRERPKLPYRVRCADETGFITLVFFHAHGDYLGKLLPVGAERIVSGKVESFNAERQMVHPDHVAPVEEEGGLPLVEPVYPLGQGLTPRVLRKAVEAALARLPELPEWQDPAWISRRGWPAWAEAVRACHHPADTAALDPARPERARLAYDELLASQLALAVVRQKQRQRPGVATVGDGRLRARVLASLPFEPTSSQRKAVAEIEADMARPIRMLRLLQGDVGSGKTLVALLSMLAAVEAGRQAAMMAPTEILARQHHERIAPLAAAAGIEALLLTGREKGKNRDRLLQRLADGSAAIAVGTHALFQEDVAFRDLALAVVDEQHRFGVHQRLMLAAKGGAADVLVMTATPIPRTMMLAAYGDMDESRLTEKPAGRRPVETRVLPVERMEDVVAAVRRQADYGGRAYWVCPLVDESEAVDLAAATERYEALRAEFGSRVGLVHGRMKGPEKDAAMARFAAGETAVLVATTVIEVGVDVPEATVMVIEHAERFGLAQLHQLRGRVGRGERASACLLLYSGKLGDTARARLSIMRQTDDGFRIAEEDLHLRGGGELLGTKQSGLPAFRLADLAAHGGLLAAARDDARLLLERDPDLSGPRGSAARTLLYLFERDASVRYLRSG